MIHEIHEGQQNPAPESSTKRFLLVECCHLPQWFYLAQQLRLRHPGCTIEALAIDRPQVRFYLKHFRCFDAVHFLESIESLDCSAFDGIVFPLLNRGYSRIKRRAFALVGEHFSTDYEGNLQPLTASTLVQSLIRPAFPPTAEFAEFLSAFPHQPLHGNILVVESAHRSLVMETSERVESHLLPEAEITRISAGSVLSNWKALRQKTFSAAIFYLSGEKGYFGLKLLPFLLRVPRILVVNESGDVRNADDRTFITFLLRRLIRRPHYFPSSPRVLVVQTESFEYLRETIRRLRAQDLFPTAQIAVVCGQVMETEIASLPGVAAVFPYSRKRDLKALFRLRKGIRAFAPDFNCAVFTGRPVFRPQKLLFFMSGSHKRFIFNSQMDGYWFQLEKLPQMLRREPLIFGEETRFDDRTRVVLFQTDSAAYTTQAMVKLKEPTPFLNGEIMLVCRKEDRPHFEGEVRPSLLLTRGSRFSLIESIRLLNKVRSFRADVKVGIFAGRSGDRLGKLLFFLAKARRRFALNAQLQGYWLGLRTLGWIFRHDRLLFDEMGFSQTKERVLLCQTESKEYTAEALRRIPEMKAFQQVELFLLCREKDQAYFEGLVPPENLVSFTSKASLFSLRRTLKQVRQIQAQMKIGIFTGRPVFRFGKALYFMASAGQRFALNAQLDGYWIGLRTMHRIFKREPLLEDFAEVRRRTAILIETESKGLVQKAAEILTQPHVTDGAIITVFCSQEREAFYSALPQVDRVVVYRKKNPLGNLRAVLNLIGTRPDAVAAVFSGRQVFFKQKLLFWLIPAHGHLAFNESLDCFYVTRHNCVQLFRTGARMSLLSLAFRQSLKGLLFIPRFLYLSGWIRYRDTLRRRYFKRHAS